MLEGAIYTVDEVSDLLGIPRPTLYRYLREYSIPHLRRSGRISIPEDSFDRIREARDLHREGLGTETVRRQLREGRGPDTVELDRRLDHLHETLEDLRGDLRERPATDEVALSPTLRTILARQSLLISAMFNLTGMVEDLLLASGKRRKPIFEDLSVGMREPLPGSAAGDRLTIGAAIPATATSVSTAVSVANGSRFLNRSTSFGTLGRRRRRSALVFLSALLVGLFLAWAVPALIGGGPGTSTSEATQTAGQSPGERSSRTEDQKAVVGEATSADETTERETPAQTPPEPAQVAAADTEPVGKILVPDVSNRRMGEAAQALSDAGLEVAFIRDETSREEPETVIGTIPAAGTSVRPGTPMTLRVSVGPPDTPPAMQSASTSASASASANASASSSISATASASANASTSASAGGSVSASASASASAGGSASASASASAQ